MKIEVIYDKISSLKQSYNNHTIFWKNMINKQDPCWCNSGKKWKRCHYPLHKNEENSLYKDYLKNYKIILKNSDQIKKIKKACNITANILNSLCKAATIGTTTNELNELSVELHKKFNAIPAPLNYGHPPFPKTICTSINDVICHGIPNDITLKSGDIMNIDVSCIVDGFYGDCSRMVLIGDVSDRNKLLCSVANECLKKAIDILKPDIPLKYIGEIISNHAESFGFSVVDQFVGHGLGCMFHEEPFVAHHRNNSLIPLAEGMIFTIEPMINAGKKEAVLDTQNMWEARTIDGKYSAQWEHAILITKNGSEVLTLPD